MRFINRFRTCWFFICIFCSFFMAILVFAVSENEEQPAFTDVTMKFTPSGWMGDGEYGRRYVNLFEAWDKNPNSDPTCIKIVYTPGPLGWAGIYWQNRPNNWGNTPGEDFKTIGYRKLSFWARGDEGGEIVEFKAGGIRTPQKDYIDSFEASTGKVKLEKDWKKFIINLNEKNLSSVIGGFCWVASGSANKDGLIFYIDDVRYEF
jgi:hypothetical protein